MFKLKHTTLLFLSGIPWLVVGSILFPLGINLIVDAILKDNLFILKRPILDGIAPFLGGLEKATLVWVAFALLIGGLKGHYVLRKSVVRSIERIQQLPEPTPISQIYSKQTFIILGVMFIFGKILKNFSNDLRGGIDVAVGVALIYGAFTFFAAAFKCARQDTVKIDKS